MRSRELTRRPRLVAPKANNKGRNSQSQLVDQSETNNPKNENEQHRTTGAHPNRTHATANSQHGFEFDVCECVSGSIVENGNDLLARLCVWVQVGPRRRNEGHII